MYVVRPCLQGSLVPANPVDIARALSGGGANLFANPQGTQTNVCVCVVTDTGRVFVTANIKPAAVPRVF